MVSRTLFAEPLFEHFQPQLMVERLQLGDEAALQPRTHALVEPLDLIWRPGRGNDDLLAAIEQRIDDVIEFLLRAFALKEFEIVDQQHVDVAEPLLEGQRIGRAKRFDELIAEAFSRQIKHLRVRCALLHFPGNGVKKMAFAEAHGRVNIERVVSGSVRQNRFGNLRGACMGHAV